MPSSTPWACVDHITTTTTNRPQLHILCDVHAPSCLYLRRCQRHSYPYHTRPTAHVAWLSTGCSYARYTMQCGLSSTKLARGPGTRLHASFKRAVCTTTRSSLSICPTRPMSSAGIGSHSRALDLNTVLLESHGHLLMVG